MSEWKTLSDIVERKICYGIVQPGNKGGNVPVIKVNNMIAGLNSIEDLETTTEEIASKYERTKLKGGELIISLVGTVGVTAIVPHAFAGCNLVRATGLIDIKDEILAKYVKYYLETKSAKEFLYGRLNTTVQPTLNVKTLENLPIPIIDRQKMIAIVSFLSTLDEKIAVNRRIYENLDAQAQALYKYWFIDFAPFKDCKFIESELGMIPEGWNVCTLGDICKCELGGTPSRANKSYWGGHIPWINSGEVNKFRICNASEFITEDGLNHSATKLLPKKTTVLAITGATLGQVSLLEIDSCANQSVVGVKENDSIPYTFIYSAIKSKIKELVNMQTGGAQQHINKENIQSLKLAVSPPKIMEGYKGITLPLFDEIGNLCFENLRLSALRDALLPKLMSGQIKL